MARPVPRAPAAREILQALDHAETRLAQLADEATSTRERISALREELAKLGREPAIRVTLPVVGTHPAPRTPQEKVSLFRRLFRGREDVYPERFVSKKTGKAGYAPACANKFVHGVCQLPKVKCGDCTQQASSPSVTAR